MFLTCPECSTRYLVNPASIGKEGRTVRCAKCAHSWFQAPPPEERVEEALTLEPPPPEPRPIPTGSGLPVVREAPPPPGWLKGTFFSALIATLLLALYGYADIISASVPALGAVYSPLGIYRTDGLRLSEIQVSQIPSRKEKRFFVRGAIVNESTEARRMPVLRMVLADADMEPIDEPFEFSDNAKKGEMLEAGQSLPFLSKIATKKEGVEHVIIDIGNSFDLKHR